MGFRDLAKAGGMARWADRTDGAYSAIRVRGARIRADDAALMVWRSPGSFGQVKMPSLLALNADDCAIGDFLVGLPVQRHPDGKAARLIASIDLNAAHGLAAGPLSNGLHALLSKSPIA